MTIKDGDEVLTLEELAQKMCVNLFAHNPEACWDGSCPATDYCRHKHNGMLDWLQEVLEQ